jgi:hypothetical protein
MNLDGDSTMKKSKISAKLIFEFSTAQEAKLVSESLAPDNKPLPKSLSLETTINDNQYEINIKVDGVIETLVNTIDDFLQHVNLFMNMKEITKK